MLSANFYKSIANRLLSKINYGSLELIETYKSPTKKIRYGEKSNPQITATLEIHDPVFFKRVVLNGEIGLGEAYVDKIWSSPHLEDLMMLFWLNWHSLEKALPFISKINFSQLKNTFLRHRTVTNSVGNNKKYISYSYDIGNDFFEWMLGPTMLYSCAVWDDSSTTLEQAQQNKLNLILKKLKADSSHQVLDIGMGWGALANFIHCEKKASVTGISLSKKQINYCTQKYPGLQFKYEDYRQHTGQYDRIVSVGMIEHVGMDYLETYFKKVGSLLKPGGRAVLQTMIFRDTAHSKNKKRYITFGHKYVLPNAELPTVSLLQDAIKKSGELSLLHLEDLGPHYGRTGHHWRKNLLNAKDKIINTYSEKLFNTYDYTWALFSASYTMGITGLVQMIVQKPLIKSNNVIVL